MLQVEEAYTFQTYLEVPFLTHTNRLRECFENGQVNLLV